jgi:hypothetical protein
MDRRVTSLAGGGARSVVDSVAVDVGPALAAHRGVPIAYIAYTERSVLMLDGDGVCVRVEPLKANWPPAASDGALRCIGAQFVATIDPTEPGGLGRLPRVGASMLFAAVDPGGRIFCVRAGPLTHFESSRSDDSGVHSTPNDTERHPSQSFQDETDPALLISVEVDDSEELETATFQTPDPQRYSSSPPPPPQSGRSMREPPPPPVPRLPRLRPFAAPSEPARPDPRSMRYAPRTPVPPSPYGGTTRGRPPSPSAHTWTDDSRAVLHENVPPRTSLRRWGR